MITPFDLAAVSVGTRLRVSNIVRVLNRYHIGCICDCGCGMGILSSAMQRRGVRVRGFDISSGLVAEVQKRLRGDALFVVGSIKDIPFGDASQDAIVAADVIEHLADPEPAFAEIARVLKPGGIAILTIPNANYERVCRLVGLSQADIGHYRTYERNHIEKLLKGSALSTAEHQTVCNVIAGLADALVARLAFSLYGKDTVQHSEMAMRTASGGLVAWTYLLACRMIYPLVRGLEYVLPASWSTENLFVLSRHQL